MKTNFQMIRDLNGFQPETRGMISGEEMEFISRTLCLDERDELSLRNLRDFVVLYFSRDMDDVQEQVDQMDKMSAIAGVIDNTLFRMGLEV